MLRPESPFKMLQSTSGKHLPTVSWFISQSSGCLLTCAGLYEQQDPNQKEHNLRGVFHTDAEGNYSFYCLRPTPYPVPQDGPAGKLLEMMDRHVFRPAHIHLMVSKLGFSLYS